MPGTTVTALLPRLTAGNHEMVARNGDSTPLPIPATPSPLPASVASAAPEAFKPPSPFWSHLWYDLAYGITMAILTLGFSLRYRGRRNVPDTGPVLIIANHQSFLDPVAIGLSCHRRLCFLARKTLFRNRFFGGLLRSLNSVPVDQQGVAKEGLRAILDQLHRGNAVLVFPEGERTWKGNLQPLKPGIHLLIKRTHCPIVPVGIAGAFDALPRTRSWPLFSPLFMPRTRGAVAVAIGEPLDAARFAAMPREQMLTELHAELAKVVAQAEALRKK